MVRQTTTLAETSGSRWQKRRAAIARRRDGRARRRRRRNPLACCGQDCAKYNFCPICGRPIAHDGQELRELQRFLRRQEHQKDRRARPGRTALQQKREALDRAKIRRALTLANSNDPKTRAAAKQRLDAEIEGISMSLQHWTRRNAKQERPRVKWHNWSVALQRIMRQVRIS